MLLASAGLFTFLIGIAALLLGQRFPQHLVQFETAAGGLFVGAFLLVGVALPSSL
jgi:hypothetical protein